MQKRLGAAVAACAMLCAGQASADAVIYGAAGPSGTAIGIDTSLPGAGDYDLWISTSDPVTMEWELTWGLKWDVYLTPVTTPPGASLDGGMTPMFAGDQGTGSALHWSFTIPEGGLTYFSAGGEYSSQGVSLGTPLYRWDRPANIYLSVHRIDGGGVVYNPSIFVTRAGPSVPEPATWAMMIGGLGVVGSMLRRRWGKTATPA